MRILIHLALEKHQGRIRRAGLRASRTPWPEVPRGVHAIDDVNHGDFKPNTPSGYKTLRHDQRIKWSKPTQYILYVPESGKLKWPTT